MKRSNGTIDLSLDYHAHVLPGCDHGSDGLETSLRQLDMAAAAGIRTVCATPHFYPHRESAESFLRRRAECAQPLHRKRCLTWIENGCVRYLGSDIHMLGSGYRDWEKCARLLEKRVP